MSQTRPVLFLARMAGAGRRPEPAATSPQNLTAILAFLNAVSRACSESPTPEAATHDCLGIVARFTGWPIAHAYRRRPDGSGAMASMRAWHLAVPDDASEAQAFVAASEGAVFAPGQGLVGRVAASGAPISCADVTILPGFVRAETASRNGVRGCFMFPVRVGDNVEIVLEFFSRDQAVLKDDLLELMAYVADRLALSITEHAQRNCVAALMRALDNVAHQLAETTARVESGAKSVQAVAEAVDERRIQVDRANGDASRDIEAASRSAQDLVILSRDAGGHAGRIEVMAGDSARILDEAVTVFTDLQNRIGDVGQISELIGTIASQTNLLALNATIEAARAGAAGRGFAVVASEVKALSHRVTQATAEIAAQVDQLRQVAARSTDSLSRVRSEIGAVQRTASDIAQVSASHQDAADTIASGVTRARTTILQAAGHLEALRSTTAAALASSQVLGETSARLRDQGRELGQATRQLAGSGR